MLMGGSLSFARLYLYSQLVPIRSKARRKASCHVGARLPPNTRLYLYSQLVPIRSGGEEGFSTMKGEVHFLRPTVPIQPTRTYTIGGAKDHSLGPTVPIQPTRTYTIDGAKHPSLRPTVPIQPTRTYTIGGAKHHSLRSTVPIQPTRTYTIKEAKEVSWVRREVSIDRVLAKHQAILTSCPRFQLSNL